MVLHVREDKNADMTAFSLQNGENTIIAKKFMTSNKIRTLVEIPQQVVANSLEFQLGWHLDKSKTILSAVSLHLIQYRNIRVSWPGVILFPLRTVSLDVPDQVATA